MSELKLKKLTDMDMGLSEFAKAWLWLALAVLCQVGCFLYVIFGHENPAIWFAIFVNTLVISVDSMAVGAYWTIEHNNKRLHQTLKDHPEVEKALADALKETES